MNKQQKIQKFVEFIQFCSKLAIGLILVIPGYSQVVDAPPRFHKVVGEILQTSGPSGLSNAWFYGKDGCKIVASYHGVFGIGKAAEVDRISGETREVTILLPKDKRVIGHPITFHFDYDPKIEDYRRSATATVVAFGEYDQKSAAGIRGDIAVLNLIPCAGPGYDGFEIDRKAENQINPGGDLQLVSSIRLPSGKVKILADLGCRAASDSPGAGLIATTCKSAGGLSGSMLLKSNSDGSASVVGLNVKSFTSDNGINFGGSISAKYINKFLDLNLVP